MSEATCQGCQSAAISQASSLCALPGMGVCLAQTCYGSARLQGVPGTQGVCVVCALGLVGCRTLELVECSCGSICAAAGVMHRRLLRIS